MRFYKIENSYSDACGVMVRDGDELYAYLANTGLWHRATALETDFYFEQERTYVEVTPEEVPDLLAGVQRIDERGSGGTHIRKRQNQPPEELRTSFSMGIPTKASDSP